jgi:adenylosuccinate lyase
MAIHPIDSRYGTREMRAVWTEEHRFSCIIRAEVALARAEAACGLIPGEDAKKIVKGAKRASLERAKEIESEIHHDMMAVVKALSEVSGEAGRWVHFGATSNDILDTATGLQLKESLALLEAKLVRLLAVLLRRAGETRGLVCAARTHGQIGIPTTYGMRFALWASEVARHLERLREIRPRVEVGKLTGAVGTMAALGKDGFAVQERMMDDLGLFSLDITNQIVPRDRYAEYFMFLAGLATTLDRIGITIRTLQRTEIGELEEPFGSKQVGSSTMPHKRNPIRSEQVSGLARIVRAAVEPSLQNNTLWDERDLTNSSCERVIFPEATILTDHILQGARRPDHQQGEREEEPHHPGRHPHGRVRHGGADEARDEPAGRPRGGAGGEHGGHPEEGGPCHHPRRGPAGYEVPHPQGAEEPPRPLEVHRHRP